MPRLQRVSRGRLGSCVQAERDLCWQRGSKMRRLRTLVESALVCTSSKVLQYPMCLLWNRACAYSRQPGARHGQRRFDLRCANELSRPSDSPSLSPARSIVSAVPRSLDHILELENIRNWAKKVLVALCPCSLDIRNYCLNVAVPVFISD